MIGEEKVGADMNGVVQAEEGPPGFFGWSPKAKPLDVEAAPRPSAGKPVEGRSDIDLRLQAAVAAMARREEDGLRDLYDATVSRVFGLALRITRNRDAAEDVVAEVFHQVWRDALRYDPLRGAALTWLLTICRSRAIDSLRRREDAESHPDPESLIGIADHDPENDPEAVLAATQRGTALHDALSSLTPIQRQLIGLAFFRGLTHHEASLHLDIPLGTVKSHVRKGLERLRAALGHDAGLPSIPPQASE